MVHALIRRLFIAFLFVSISSPALACKCVGPRTYDVEFEGRVIGIVPFTGSPDTPENFPDSTPVRFAVEKAVKGVSTEEVEVTSSSVQGCGVYFEIGKHYKVFALNPAHPETKYCYGTVEIAALQLAAPEKYELKLVIVSESIKPEFFFVIGNSGFKSVNSLKAFLGSRPPGTELRWAPSCRRMGGEPLLSSEAEMNDFKAFLKEKGIKFTLVPSG